MSFELKQTITQILAFLIMLWILNRYTWKPLLSLLDERKRKIQSLFKEADQKNQEADARLKEYNEKINLVKQEGQLIIQNSIKEAKKIANDLQADAQQKVQKMIEKAHEQSARDLQKAKAEFKKEMIAISFVALEKLIHVKLNQADRDRFALETLDDI
jgi:F-type H+-transporting ATPase subunit b